MKNLQKILLVALALLANGPLHAQPVLQFYSAYNFLNYSPTGQPLTNAITIQPWPATSATTLFGNNFVIGPAQTLTPTNGTNWFYLYPNTYRITWQGLPYGATFSALPGSQDLTNLAQEVNTGAGVFTGTNNFQYQAVVDPNDTTPGTLSAKVVLGVGGYITTNNVNGNEQLVFNFATNLSTYLSAIGFTNTALIFSMNGAGLYVQNTNGGAFFIDTNFQILDTNRYGGTFGFSTNSFAVTVPSPGNPAAAALLLSNGTFTVSANETAPSLTVATNIIIGSATLTAGTGAIVFTNGTQANINSIFAQVSTTVYTNTVFGFSIASNGQWNYLNAAGQTMWTLGGSPVPSVPIGYPWTISTYGFGTAPGSSPVTSVSGVIQFGGQIAMTNLQASGSFNGPLNGNATTATGATYDSTGRVIASLAQTNDTRAVNLQNPANQFNGSIANSTNSVNAQYAGNATNDFNGRSLAVVLDTNVFSQLCQDEILISSVTNLPTMLLTNPFYFSPALGPNYVQLAVNSLPTPPNRLTVGGGKIIVIGQNFYPSPLIFTNAVATNVMNFDVEAPTFAGGALICATNPAIRVGGQNRGVNFELKNLIVSSLNNSPTNLVEIGQSSIGTGANVGILNVDNNWFGYWNYLTNNQDSYGLAGLTPPTTGNQISQMNLIFYVDNGNSDMDVFHNNHFLGMQSFYLSPDHCDFSDNFFSYCGGSYATSGTNATAWTNGIYDLGAAVILGNTGANQESWWINNTHFYSCYAGWYSQTGNSHIAWNTYYEGTTQTEQPLSELGTLPILNGVTYENNMASPGANLMNGLVDSKTNILANDLNQDVGYYSLPFGDSFEIGDQYLQFTLEALYPEKLFYKTNAASGTYTNAPIGFKIQPNTSTVEMDAMLMVDGHNSLLGGGNNNPIYQPAAQIVLNATNGAILLSNLWWGTYLLLQSNSVSADVPFIGSGIGLTNALNFSTNTGPTGVTWGTTAPDYWVKLTNTLTAGAMWMPCWTNH